MKRSEFDYQLPKELIATHPLPERSQSRLMVLDRNSGRLEHRVFDQLPDILNPPDLLALNNTRVFPARLIGHRQGASIETLLLREKSPDVWEVLVKPSKKISTGSRLSFGNGLVSAEVLEKGDYGRCTVRFRYAGDFNSILDQIGETPLPPYMKRSPNGLDRERYQTVYGNVRGSVAAPTAGLHFTDTILKKLEGKAVNVCQITLHVGYGTFQTVRVEQVEQHRMELETYEVSTEAARRINAQLESGGRIVAVGTTTTRTLEHIGSLHGGKMIAGGGWTDLFIYPGYRFKIVSGLLTNFHLPRSTLLMLVCAFAGTDLILHAYHEAIKERYRFYSYGDCMLIT